MHVPACWKNVGWLQLRPLGIFYTLSFLHLTFGSTSLQYRQQGLSGLGTTVHPMDHPGHDTLEGLALTCCMGSHMGQQSDERAGEPV